MSKKVKSNDGQCEFFADEENYRNLCVPFENIDAANKALNAFNEELYELRNKHRIKDVQITTEVFCIDSEGDEGAAQSTFHYGSRMQALPMAAFAFGQEKIRLAELIAKLAK